MKKISYLLILICVFAVGCAEKPIGGEKDEHGCLLMAGYTWCEAKQKCLRTWEEECAGTINSFEECAAAGNPVMESYPRQCRTPDGQNFVEKIKLSIEEAIQIAQNSECAEKGELRENSFHNDDTNTWWIDLEMKEEFRKDYCNPACVVSDVTRAAEINWRCAGALPPE